MAEGELLSENPEPSGDPRGMNRCLGSVGGKSIAQARQASARKQAIVNPGSVLRRSLIGVLTDIRRCY